MDHIKHLGIAAGNITLGLIPPPPSPALIGWLQATSLIVGIAVGALTIRKLLKSRD
jgi:ABC-type antimicrobial peptide transport system permease subunit